MVLVVHHDFAAHGVAVVEVDSEVEAFVATRADECGCAQRRSRRIQFEHKQVHTVVKVKVERRSGSRGKRGSAVKTWVVGACGRRKVTGPCGSEDDELTKAIDDHRVGLVGLVAADVRRINPLAAVAREFGDANIHCGNPRSGVVVGGVKGAGRGGVAGSEYDAATVQVLLRIKRGSVAPVIGRGTRKA